jgi:acyl-CoA thioester hydrolase
MSAEASVRVPIRWRDLDMLGHLNQAVYHELLEEARGTLFASLGDVAGFPFVLVRVELDYRTEVRRDHDYVEAVARVTGVGRTSITAAQEIRLPDGTVAADGSCVMVAWDGDSRSARELSEAERDALEA